ncbi:MAG: hypothetical protein ABIH23_06625 [bacterium]
MDFETQVSDFVTKFNSWSVCMFADDHGRQAAEITISTGAADAITGRDAGHNVGNN